MSTELDMIWSIIYLCPNLLPHSWHTKGFSPVWTTSCSFILVLSPNTLLQYLHLYASLCAFRWTNSDALQANVFGQNSHRCGLAPVCEFIWSLSSAFVVHPWLQTGHILRFILLGPPGEKSQKIAFTISFWSLKLPIWQFGSTQILISQINTKCPQCKIFSWASTHNNIWMLHSNLA